MPLHTIGCCNRGMRDYFFYNDEEMEDLRKQINELDK